MAVETWMYVSGNDLIVYDMKFTATIRLRGIHYIITIEKNSLHHNDWEGFIAL
jgi:hypothetical protein